MPTDQLEFGRFHEDELPRRLAAGHGALARDLAARLGPLTVGLPDGRAYTYVATDDSIEIRPGDEKTATKIELDPEVWLNLVQDLESGPGLLYSRRGKVRQGKGPVFLEWESGWRAMYHGRPIFDPADQASEGLLDRRGQPLDLSRKFDLDSDLDDMVHFMKQAGFVLIGEAFSPEEVADFWQASEDLYQQAHPDDKSSWWGKSSKGQTVLTRVLDGSGHPSLQGLEDEVRLTRLVQAVEPGLIPNFDGDDFISVLYKNPDMVEGLSDLPWHRDCGMGGHAIMCPTINLSIFLSEATEATGPLKALPGSHRGSVPFIDANATIDVEMSDMHPLRL